MAKKQEPKTNAQRILDTAKIAYDTLAYDCDGENFDGKLVASQLGLPCPQVFKTLVLKNEAGKYLVCCVPVDKKLDLKALAAAADCKRAEMLPLNDILAVTGYIRGGCSPIGMKKQYDTFFDESALSHDKIAVSAGKRGLQLYLSSSELISFIKAKTGAFTMDGVNDL